MRGVRCSRTRCKKGRRGEFDGLNDNRALLVHMFTVNSIDEGSGSGSEIAVEGGNMADYIKTNPSSNPLLHGTCTTAALVTSR